jgi:hypothetical protein
MKESRRNTGDTDDQNGSHASSPDESNDTQPQCLRLGNLPITGFAGARPNALPFRMADQSALAPNKPGTPLQRVPYSSTPEVRRNLASWEEVHRGNKCIGGQIRWRLVG